MKRRQSDDRYPGDYGGYDDQGYDRYDGGYDDSYDDGSGFQDDPFSEASAAVNHRVQAQQSQAKRKKKKKVRITVIVVVVLALRRLRAARRELLVRRDAIRNDERQIRPDGRAHRAQRGRMSQMRRVEAAAIDADLHLRAFFTSSIFGFCSLRL